MALNAAIEFDVRTTGSDTNGGGFKRGATGTDWSQQAAAQYSVTDGVTAGTTTITSATANFGTDVVGNVMYVQGGTGSVTAGWYEITVRNSATSVTVDRSTGLTAGTGVTLKIGGSFLTIAAPLAITVAQNIVWVKNGSYSVGTTLTVRLLNSLPNANPGRLLGYDATHGDNPTGSSRPVITASAAIDILTVADNNFVVGHLILDCNSTGNRGVKWTGGDAWRGARAIWCAARNFKTYGFDSPSLNGSPSYYYCEATGGNSGATAGISAASGYSVLVGCWSRGNVCHGFRLGTCCTVVRCVAAGNTGASSDGFNWDDGTIVNSSIVHSVAYGNGRSGLRSNGATYSAIAAQGNIFVGNGAYGIDFPFSIPVATEALNYNAFYNNTSGAIRNITAGPNDLTLTGDPFTNSSSGDFSLNNTASAGAACRAVGYLGVFPGGLSTGYLDIGAVQHADPAGGTGPVGRVVMARAATQY